MPESDLYEFLHLHPSAHPDVIQAAYRRLALLYHPDKNPSPGASELMAQLNHAYEILSDPEKRAAYDRSREAQGGPTATSPSSTSSTQGSSSPRSAPRDSEGYFTLGSTKEEVWDIQGPPDQVEPMKTKRGGITVGLVGSNSILPLGESMGGLTPEVSSESC